MARSKSGGFNKILNFIGLVDDEDPRDTYGEEYQSDNYGRQQAYVPAGNSRQRSARQPQPAPRQPQRRSLPEPQARSSRFDDRPRSRSYDDYDTESRASHRRSASRFADEVPAYDYSPRSASRSSSRFDMEEQPPQRSMPARNARVSRRSRTVMYSLHSLEDCCEVIDNLIANNTVVLTMDELDGRLMQRAVDTLSGAVFALHASIRKASDKTYLIAPMTVEVNETYDVDRRF